MWASFCPRSTESKYRLLYVGDDLKLLAGLRTALPKADYQIVSCGDRESAIMFLKSDISYQLLMIDFQWREWEGLKLASLARLLKHRKQMPTILVTATELSRQLKSKVRNAGVNECVTKTLDTGAIIETIRRLTAV